MSFLRWHHRPMLRRPVLVAAFEGWNDAGEAATTALRHMATELGAETIATIDPEEFYDFTVARPTVRVDQHLQRSIEWPTPTFEAAVVEPGTHDVVFLSAIEPSLKWRTWCEEVLTVCRELQIEMVVTLGALLADVPHTRPVRVTGTATDERLLNRFAFQRSRYQGPTGIVGVLHDACTRADFPTASLWAATPHYLSQTPSPKAALALVRKATEIVGAHVDVTELEIATAAYERQVDTMLEGEDDMTDYVRRLEEDATEDEIELQIPHPDSLAAEVERFLRDQDR